MPGNMQDWRKAMNEALKRTGKRLFESGYNAMRVYMVLEPSRAWCCSPYTPLSSRSAQGPQKTKAHLRTANHFREWCLQHPAEAVEKFPETRVIFAEIELTKGPPHVKDEIAKAVKNDLTGLAKGLLGRPVK